MIPVIFFIVFWAAWRHHESRVTGEHRLERDESLRIQRELESVRRMESVGEMASGVAHDFKHIVGILKNYTNFIEIALRKDEISGKGEVFEDLDTMKEAIAQGEHLANSLGVIGRRGATRPIEVDLNAVVERLRPLFHFSQIETHSILDPHLPHVFADVYQMEQIIMNLAFNARDAIHGAGRVVIQTSRVEDSVCLTVSDNGEGMSAETVARCMEPMFTTKKNGKLGAGLGLATVYGVVTKTGGSVEIDSTLGKGTKFIISLPAIP